MVIMILSKDLFESERGCQRWKWTTRSLRMWRDRQEVLWRTPSSSSTSSRRTTWSSRSRKRYKCWFRTLCLGLILRRNLSATWRWSRRCRNKRRGLWSCPGTPKLALMGFEQNNKVNHLWRFDLFFCKCYCVPLFYSYHLNLSNAIVRQERRKSKQSVSLGARSWRRVWSSLLSLSFTGNLIPALFLLDWAVHVMLKADVRAWKGLFLKYTIAMCTYMCTLHIWDVKVSGTGL